MIHQIERRPWLALLLVAVIAAGVLLVADQPWILIIPALVYVVRWSLRVADRWEAHACRVCGQQFRGANLVIHESLSHPPSFT